MTHHLPADIEARHAALDQELRESEAWLDGVACGLVLALFVRWDFDWKLAIPAGLFFIGASAVRRWLR